MYVCVSGTCNNDDTPPARGVGPVGGCPVGHPVEETAMSSSCP